MEKKKKRLIQSVVRALSILNCLQDGEEIQIRDFSIRLNLDKGTVYHLLATLKELQYVKQNPLTKGYSVGIQTFRVGHAYLNALDLVKVAKKHLELLNEKTKETIHLGELLGADVIYLDKVESPLSITMRSRIGISKPAYSTGIGKILLAFQSPEKLKNILHGIVFKPHTKNTITNKKVLYNKLREYRKIGFSIDDEEIEEGLFCVAAPIMDKSNQIIAAVSISLPKYRAEKRVEELINLVKKTGKKISTEMGQE
jgi:IclR family KDG regulon transcriptional repressor